MDKYNQKINEIFNQLQDHGKLILATTDNNKVSARNMSFIIYKQCFYFQTDIAFRKYKDIQTNNHVALCIDNIQIEGLCKELCHPSEHEMFKTLFQKYSSSSFEAYTFLPSERLFVIEPTFIQRWNYVNNLAVIEQLDIEQKKYTEEPYPQIK